MGLPAGLDEQIAGQPTLDVAACDRWFENLETADPALYDESMDEILKADQFKY